jgi:hypothetical protein
MRYQIITLVDITKTNPHRGSTDSLTLGQQSNYNTLIQTIGLRANIDNSIDPTITTGRLSEPFVGKGAYWTFIFEVERDDIFAKDADPIGLLKDDLNNVPVVTGLKDTVNFKLPVFQTTGNLINTHIEKLTT